jgi:Gnt-I system low-affinity gluconate transporter
MLTLLFALLAGIGTLFFLILFVRIQPFLALLMVSILVGLMTGLPPAQVMESIQKGMGTTLGFVATVVGLGSILGALLEQSGGAGVIAAFLIQKMGEKRAPLALGLTAFVVAIPIFFEVAFIILVPVLFAIQRKTGRSLLLFAMPMLAGLAATHAFMPPHPGPVAVTEILGADIGWVILVGILAGIPAMLVGGWWFGRWISARIQVNAPEILFENAVENTNLPSVSTVFSIVGLPILLIIASTIFNGKTFFLPENSPIIKISQAIGHPFSALILANLLAWYLLGVRRGYSKAALFQLTSKSLAPAGAIILLVGAGGAFKQILVDTGVGKMIATSMTALGFPILLFAFLAAALIRLMQGSATVAMITAAGLVAPLLAAQPLDALHLACLVIAIASGASTTSHVNDSGFWLVSQYLGLSERQTFRSWTVLTTLLAVTGLAVVATIWCAF